MLTTRSVIGPLSNVGIGAPTTTLTMRGVFLPTKRPFGEFYSGIMPGDIVTVERTRYCTGTQSVSVRGDGAWLSVSEDEVETFA